MIASRPLHFLAAPLILATLASCSGGSASEPVQVQVQVHPVTDRQLANVMSYRGADWLEREGREEAELPDEVVAKMGLRPGDTVADVGCGTGFFTRRMAVAIRPGGIAYGVDVQPEMLEQLERNAEEAGLDNIEPVLSTDTDPKLPKGQIDWILIVDVYHEMQEPEEMLAALRESLAPDGRVALLEYRLLGETAALIHIDHRMSVEQVLAEWEPAGFELVELYDFLPSQHFFVFKKTS